MELPLFNVEKVTNELPGYMTVQLTLNRNQKEAAPLYLNYRKKDSSGWESVPVSSDCDVINIEGLSDKCNYEFCLAAMGETHEYYSSYSESEVNLINEKTEDFCQELAQSIIGEAISELFYITCTEL